LRTATIPVSAAEYLSKKEGNKRIRARQRSEEIMASLAAKEGSRRFWKVDPRSLDTGLFASAAVPALEGS